MIFLLRLCPIAPFTVLNYLMGLTSISVYSFFLGGFGMLPGSIVYIFLGTTISNIADAAEGNFQGGWLTLVLLICGCIMGLIAVVYISLLAKRYL